MDVKSDGQFGSARWPAMVSDAIDSTYVVINDASNEIARLSESGDIIDSYEFDDRWQRVRPIAIGAEKRLMLEATQLDRNDAGAFASVAIYSAVTRYDIELSVDQTSRQEVVARK